MKRAFSLLTYFFSSLFFINAQTTLTLRPNPALGKDATISTLNPTLSYGTDPDLAAITWTNSGVSFTERGLLWFDLSSIPQNATITAATLSLFSNPTSSNTQLSTGANACLLQRITSTWTESGVTWNNQPTTTTANQDTLLQSTSTTQNYANINVKNLVIDMVNNPTTSFGFMLKLISESVYHSMVLASSDHSDSTKRPMLVITFSVPPPCENTIILRPNASQGKDAYVENFDSTTNYGIAPNFAAIAWTGSGHAFISRSIMQFDFSTLPSSAVIMDAQLNLYCNTTSEHTQLHSGLNASYLQRITSTWSENTVNWVNQPSTTTTNQVTLAQSTSQTQDYLNIDVKNLLIDMISNPTTSFGFLIKLQTEATYRSLVFANSDHADSTKWPRLVICYKLTSTAIKSVEDNNSINIFPNPSAGNFTIYYENNAIPYTVRIFNINGQLMESRQNILTNELPIDNQDISNNKGIYFVEIESSGAVYRKKIAIL